ncbi:MAG TPA: MazG nucleotide pyrophosphohydrolase domain-containing protein [Nitrospira sp.]|nr:MazG nucleotide pyrophosphohydrolase domain-containing protein [Nitrospira sp.]
MTDEQAMVETFHNKFEILVQITPMDVSEETKQLRVRLIQEEFDELKEAMVTGNLAAVAKEMADLLYVTYGTAVSYGIDMEPVFQEVHRSNLSKVGGYKRADGKWVKPPTYSPADVQSIVEVQREQLSAERPSVHETAAYMPQSS